MLVKTFKIVILTLLLLYNCQLIAQSVKTCKEGKVSFTIAVENGSIAKRDISVAKFINEYIEKKAKDDFPGLSLHLYNQEKNGYLANFQKILICYSRYNGEHFHSSKGGHICIYLALFDDHIAIAKKAIKHVVKKYNKFQRKKGRSIYKNEAVYLLELNNYLFIDTQDINVFAKVK